MHVTLDPLGVLVVDHILVYLVNLVDGARFMAALAVILSAGFLVDLQLTGPINQITRRAPWSNLKAEACS